MSAPARPGLAGSAQFLHEAGKGHIERSLDVRGFQSTHVSGQLFEAVDIRQNLFLAFAYNAVGVPVAAGALYPAIGLLVSPIWASAAMTFSSVSVIVNALRLRAVDLDAG